MSTWCEGTMWPVTTALITLIIALGGVVLNQVAVPMVKAEQEHRQYLRGRAAWQVAVLDSTLYGRGAAACARCSRWQACHVWVAPWSWWRHLGD